MNNSFDRISWELVEITRDTIKKNIVSAVTSEQIAVSRDVLPKLFSLIDASVTEAYNKSSKSISRKLGELSEEKKSDESIPKKRK